MKFKIMRCDSLFSFTREDMAVSTWYFFVYEIKFARFSSEIPINEFVELFLQKCL